MVNGESKGGTIKQHGFRYIDIESGQTIEAYFPEERNVARSCLAQKYGFIRAEEFDIEIDLAAPIVDTEDAYARLQLLSRREAQPNSVCLDRLFGQKRTSIGIARVSARLQRESESGGRLTPNCAHEALAPRGSPLEVKAVVDGLAGAVTTV